ncbi:hypothetical protein CEXT_586261 [Caerostris extrusa]|uniref:Uncharacterized protein n=1 Tax=Caerostris extrusa TaxID=172846 RepID=A0AAV4WBV7_CAEEX|nr:hypothetical protein CEXT_586261 [Caerostris extrusa]
MPSSQQKSRTKKEVPVSNPTEKIKGPKRCAQISLGKPATVLSLYKDAACWTRKTPRDFPDGQSEEEGTIDVSRRQYRSQSVASSDPRSPYFTLHAPFIKNSQKLASISQCGLRSSL